MLLNGGAKTDGLEDTGPDNGRPWDFWYTRGRRRCFSKGGVFETII